MTKKQLIEKVAELEKRISDLEKRPAVVINNPPERVLEKQTPWIQPVLPAYPHTTWIGDPPYHTGPTCGGAIVTLCHSRSCN